MKIKRFIAPDMRRAIRQVREEQGPDAVILSNRGVDGGIELIAAVDYDEALINQALGLSRQASEPAAGLMDGTGPETLIEPDEADPEPPAVADRPAPAAPDPALAGVRREVESLRQLLECQLSSLAWNDLARQRPARAQALRQLASLGLEPELARELVEEEGADSTADSEELWRAALKLLASRLPVLDDDIRTSGGVVAVVGPTGVGKTTSVAKLAAGFVLRHGAGRVALVSTDTFRIGAREQLATFGRILGVPVHLAGDRAELKAILASLEGRRLVLIDTAGMSQRDLRLAGQFAKLRAGGARVRVLLALAATSQQAALDETVKVFGELKPAGTILTKVDEAAELGGSLSVLIRHRLPVAYVTDGQRVPEDLHGGPGLREWLIRAAVTLTRSRRRNVDEEVMANQFGEVITHAHA